MRNGILIQILGYKKKNWVHDFEELNKLGGKDVLCSLKTKTVVEGLGTPAGVTNFAKEMRARDWETFGRVVYQSYIDE